MYNQKPILGTLPNYAHPLTPTAAWIMNEGSGNKIYDIIGRNHGTFGAGAAAPTWKPGRTGSALDFDGTDDYINTPVNLNWTEGSIGVWAKSDDLNARNLFVYTADDGLSTYSHMAGFRDTGYIHAYIYDGTQLPLDSDITVSAGNWYHVVITWKVNDYFKLFVNGNLENQVAMGTAWKDGNKFLIGKNSQYTTLQNYFSGAIDEVHIYNWALSAAEIWQLYVDPYCWLAEPYQAELMYAAPPAGVMSPYYYESLMAGAVI